MSATRKAGGLVQRRAAASPAVAAAHRPPPRGKASRKVHEGHGALTLRIVSGSIRDATLAAVADAGDRLFDVTLRPLAGGRARAKVLVRKPSTLGPISLPPGNYTIDVAEHVSAGAFQKYPDGACEAVVHAGKTTAATVVLATDTLRAIADACGFRIGTLVTIDDIADPTRMLTFESEFNVATVCIPWGSIHPTTPDAHTPPLSAPICERLSGPALDAALVANGWSLDRIEPVFQKLLGYPNIEVLPTPLVWFTSGESPKWLVPHIRPSPHALVADQARALVRWVKKLGVPAHEWVAVNELEDCHDTEFWGGVSSSAASTLEGRLSLMARHYLEIVHAEAPAGLLLLNDFDHELYPPASRGAKGKLGREIARLRAEYTRAAPFHTTMAAVQRVPALRGKVAAGYQMHFSRARDYLAATGLYRGALQTGIRKLRRLGAKVHVTEMAISVTSLLGRGAPHFTEAPSYDPTPGSAWQKWDASRQAAYGKLGYAVTRGTAIWRKQAQVFRDIVRTVLSEPECDTVVFWGMADKPEDDPEDIYGHLFDSVPGGTPGAYPSGAGCPRKPAYYAVLNALVEAGHDRRGQRVVPNWRRRWSPHA